MLYSVLLVFFLRSCFVPVMVFQAATRRCNCSDAAGVTAALSTISFGATFFASSISFGGARRRLTAATWLTLQNDGTGLARSVVAPLELASAFPLFPMPSFADRVAASADDGYTRSSEFVVLAGVLVALAYYAALAAVLLTHLNTVVVRSSAPGFTCASLAGAALMTAAPAVWSLDDNRAACTARVWLLSLGFSALFAALFVKLYRVHRIFLPSRLTQRVISTRSLVLAYGSALLVELIYLSLWTGLVPPAVHVIGVDGGTVLMASSSFAALHPALSHRECSFSPGFAWTSVAFKLLLLGALLKLCWRGHRVPEVFNETSAVASAAFKFVFGFCLLAPFVVTTSMLPDSVDRSSWSIMLSQRESFYLLRSFG